MRTEILRFVAPPDPPEPPVRYTHVLAFRDPDYQGTDQEIYIWIYVCDKPELTAIQALDAWLYERRQEDGWAERDCRSMRRRILELGTPNISRIYHTEGES